MRFLLLTLLLSTFGFGQVLRPLLSFDKQLHDFGKIAEDKEVTCKFKAINEGLEVVNMWKIAPSCGCFTVDIGQWRLKPGESTDITVILNPKSRPGELRKPIRVFFDVGEGDRISSSTATLTVQADVIQDIMPSKTTLFFEDISRNTPSKDSIRLHPRDNKDFKVLEVKGENAPYWVATHKKEGKDVVIDVVFDPAKLPADKSSGTDTLLISTDHPKLSLIKIDAKWNISPQFTTTPARVAWFKTTGVEHKATITIKHVQNKPFKILSAKPSNSLLKVEGIAKPAAPQHELTVILSEKAQAGTYSETVQLTLDDPAQKDFEFRVSALLKEKP